MESPTVYPKGIPLLTNSPLVTDPHRATVHPNPSTDPAVDPGGDSLLNVLINADISSSSLKTTSNLASVTSPNALWPLRTPTVHLKVVNS
ncbi:unnamed protein product [Dicrocoelium dendriticum]|nr:unnamed protein product [Dicrocoelium dendriticum]